MANLSSAEINKQFLAMQDHIKDMNDEIKGYEKEEKISKKELDKNLKSSVAIILASLGAGVLAGNIFDNVLLMSYIGTMIGGIASSNYIIGASKNLSDIKLFAGLADNCEKQKEKNQKKLEDIKTQYQMALNAEKEERERQNLPQDLFN